MTRAQLITALWLVTVICLGSAALLLPEPGSNIPEPVKLVGFPPSRVAAVEVGLPDGSHQQLLRSGPDRWEIALPVEGEPARWPAATERVRAFLRILDRLQGAPTDEATTDPASTVTIVSDQNERATIGLPASSLGGRAIVRVSPGGPGDSDPAWYLTTDELTRLITSQGLLQWLDARAFASADDQVSRVTVSSLGGAMSLTRTGAAWRIETPFQAPAEASLVAEMIQGLQTLPLADPSTSPPEPPADATTVTLETTRRQADAEGSVAAATTTHTLQTLGPVTETGRVAVRVASRAADSTTAGPLTATIDAAALTELVRGPEFYIARRASTAQPGDIRSLTLTLPDDSTLSVTRTDAGWSRDGAAMPPDQADAVEALVELLTLTNATTTAHAPQRPAEAQHLADITAQGLGGLTLATLDLSVAPLPGAATDSRAYALLRTGEISRYYAPEAAVEAVRWVAELQGTP